MEMEDDSSLSRSMFAFHSTDSNTSLSNLLNMAPDGARHDYLDVSIDLNSVFELNNSATSEAVDVNQSRSLTTPTVPDNENSG